MTTAEPIAIEKDGWKARLKWHRGRRQAGDLPFDPRRLRQGIAAGASLEIDLRVHAEGSCAVLHDEWLDEETTGTGPVRAASVALLRSLRLRDNAGAPSDQPIMLLEELCQFLASADASQAPLLQLDYQESETPSPEVIAGFASAVGPVVDRVILSGGYPQALEALAAGLPDLSLGYDPCYGDSLERLKATGDFTRFIRDAFVTAPKARIIYLEHNLLLAGADQGVNLVAECHQAGLEVDAWTITKITDESLRKVHRLMELQVDQITTDDPQGLVAAFQAGR